MAVTKVRVPLITGTSPNQSTLQGQPEMVNMYLENTSNASGIEEFAAYGTEGLLEYLDIGGTSVRSLFEHRGTLYVVIDNTVYSVDTTPSATSLGTLSTSTGAVSVSATQDYIIWSDATDAKYYQLSTTTFGTVSDADYPDGSDSLAHQDSYIIARVPDSGATLGRFQVSDSSDPTSWAALAVGTAESSADALVAVHSDLRDLYLFGSRSIEIWANAADPPVIFNRRNGMTLHYGCGARDSVAQGTDRIFFLGASAFGSKRVFALQNYQIQRISTSAIEQEIQGYTTTSDADGFYYENSGHGFYVLTFPTELKTLVYDLTTNTWHRRSSYLPSLSATTPNNRWKANKYAYFNGKHIVGDVSSGKLLEIDTNTFTDDGATVTRSLRSLPIYAQNNEVTASNFTLVYEPGTALSSGQGSDPEVKLRISDDGGFTWGPWLTRKLGQQGSYTNKVIWGQAASGNSIVVELETSDPIKLQFLALYADVEVIR